MADPDLDRMKEVAKAATPGEWLEYGELDVDLPYSLFSRHAEGSLEPLEPLISFDRAFVVAAQPRAVLSLIERLEKAEAEIEYWKSYAEGAMEAQRSELAANRTLRADLAEAVEALVVLNAALDAFWNAPDRGPVWNIRGTVVQDISDAQTRSARIVAKHEEPEHD